MYSNSAFRNFRTVTPKGYGPRTRLDETVLRGAYVVRGQCASLIVYRLTLSVCLYPDLTRLCECVSE